MGLGDFLSGILGTNSSVQTGQSLPIEQLDYSPVLQSSLTGYGNSMTGQRALAQQLAAGARGQGPNPATSMLQAAQAQNAQQAMNVYANNRAINPALAARQASRLQSDANSQAANQAATLTAQQQLGSQQALGGLYGQMGNQSLNLYGTAQQAHGQQNNAINSANAINAGVAAGNQQQAGNIVGGLIGSAGAAAGMGAHGGMVVHLADGGDVTSSSRAQRASNALSSFGSQMETESGPQSNVGRFLAMAQSPGMAPMARGGQVGSRLKAGGGVPGKAKVAGNSYSNDTVPALLSPGEYVFDRETMQDPKAIMSKAKSLAAAVMARQRMGKKK